jgi:hypothetical protein
MSRRFEIFVHKNSDNLHLKLIGEFDGSSALQLINYLKRVGHGVSTVFIHTNCLKDIHPFGQHIFQQNLSNLKRKTVSYVFTGEKANQLELE